ncbi:MAG: hypothetical protein ACO3FQ_03810 [Terrimicrobiaceae bacterium]
MTLGRTSSGAIKIKTDGGLRAVECACCGCDLPASCLLGVKATPFLIDFMSEAGFCASQNNQGPNNLGYWEIASGIISATGEVLTEVFGFGIPDILGGAYFYGYRNDQDIIGSYTVMNMFADPPPQQTITLVAPPCPPYP